MSECVSCSTKEVDPDLVLRAELYKNGSWNVEQFFFELSSDEKAAIKTKFDVLFHAIQSSLR